MTIVQRGSVLEAADQAADDNLGRSVSLSEDGLVLVVSANAWEGVTGTNRGGVYIFDKNGTGWTQRGSVLQAGDAADNDAFGIDVALSGDGLVLAVGASAWEGAAGTDQGGVYIFDKNGTGWTQRGSVLQAGDAADNDAFGLSVSVDYDGSVLAVGAGSWEGAVGTGRGGVYIYDIAGSVYTQRGSVLQAGDAADGDGFGRSVSLSNDDLVLVVSANAWEGVTGTNRGGVYIFDKNGTGWTQRGSVLEAGDAADNDAFGIDVALSGDGLVLAVGASAWEGAAGTDRGGVYIYDKNGTGWIQRGSVLEAGDAADSDNFGVSVTFGAGSTVLAVGAMTWEDTATLNTGGVYIYDITSDVVSGTIAGTFDDLTGQFTGIVSTSLITGEIAGTFDDLTGDIIAAVVPQGILSGTFDDLTGSITAAVIPHGVIAGTLDDLTGLVTAIFTEIITLPIEQTIAYAAGDINLLFTQSITHTGDINLTFEQRIFNPVSLIYVDWTVEVNVGGIDISADLTGQVRIEAARSAARIAEFTVILSGAVDVLAWAGKSTAIDYIQGDGARWRRFTGVIETPAVDIDTGTLHCTCTDELQRIIDGQSKTQLNKLVPEARWSPHVFNADRTGWDYLQDLLSTARVSVERESNGMIKANPWQAKAAADYTYTDAQVLDNPGIAIDLPSRMDMINRVDIELQASSENRYHQTQRLSWSIGSFCNFAQNSLWPPAKSMVKEAIESAGWKMISADYTPLWPSGVYNCSGQTIVFANQDPEAIIGFAAKAAYRWSQNDDHVYKISVKSNASIAAYGELAETISAHAQFDPVQADWGGDDDDYSAFPDNTIQMQPGRLMSSTLNYDELAETVDTLIAQAVAKIENSHRRNIIRYDLPLAPYLELSHTLALDLADVSARGPVQELVETYDLGSGQAITSVTLALSSGQSGLINTPAPRPFNQITAPEPDPAPGVAIHSRSFVTYIGGLAASPPEDANWSGYLVNAKPEAPGSETYTKGFRIVFDAIEEPDTANRTTESSYTVAVNVPHDPLIMTV